MRHRIGDSDRRLPRALQWGGIALVVALVGVGFGFGAGWVGSGDEGQADEPAAQRIDAGTESSSEVTETSGGLWTEPGFRALALRRGARVPLHERPNGPVVANAKPRTEFGSPQILSVVRRRGAWLAVTSEQAKENQLLWARADPARMTFGTMPFSIHVSLSEQRAELRKGRRVLRRFPVTIGAPSTATPTGRFAVTDVVTEGLNPVYGCCALALTAHQPSLPRTWMGGDRIAIHGTTVPIGGATSNGCLRAGDEAIDHMVRVVPLGTPVFIKS